MLMRSCVLAARSATIAVFAAIGLNATAEAVTLATPPVWGGATQTQALVVVTNAASGPAGPVTLTLYDQNGLVKLTVTFASVAGHASAAKNVAITPTLSYYATLTWGGAPAVDGDLEILQGTTKLAIERFQ